MALLISGEFFGDSRAEGKLVMEYFYHPECPPCMDAKRLIELLERDYSPHIEVKWRNMEFLDEMERFLSYNLSQRPAVVFNQQPSTALYDMSEEDLRGGIERYLASSDEMGNDVGPISRRLELTFPLVVVSGFVDGINPCAFALMMFFVSFLYGLKRTRRNVVGIGLIYVLGVFLGYMGLGLGLLHTVRFLGVERPFSIAGIILLILMGVLQIRDATISGPSILRFPSHAVPSLKRLSEGSALPFAFAMGCLVSLLEFPCSGAIYVGILVLLSSAGGLYQGLLYLVLYNVMFVAPLLALLLLASSAEDLVKMRGWSAGSRRRMKLLSGVFLFALAALMTYWLYLT